MSDDRHHDDGDDCCAACGFAQKLEQAHRDPGATITSGAQPATFHVDERGVPRGASVIVRGARDSEAAQVVPVTKASVVIGRNTVADVVVKDDALSRKQCALSFEGGGVVVKDLGSSCGTYVNGEKIGGAGRRLMGGDKILVGNTIIEVATE